MKKVAVYSGTSNLYGYMVTAAKSLMINSDIEKIYFLIENSKFPYSLPDNIECIDVSGQEYFDKDGPNMDKSHFTYMAYMRGVLAKLFPQYDTILSLDVDTIVDQDISDIWDFDISDYYFCAGKELAKSHDDFVYYNTGVCLFNLKKIREDKIDDKVIEMINSKSLPCPEQDAFTELCQGHVLEMPCEYNATRYTIETRHPKIIHYAGMRNWFDQPEVKEYAKYDFDDIKRHTVSKKSTHRSRIETMYMIHACNERMWYVHEFLIPSLEEQGISKDNIIIWNDKDGKGNLESFMQSMKWIGETQLYLGGIWHIQDDVVISKDFAEITQKYDRGIVCGFCNERFDGGNVNLVGIVPVLNMWLSFQCMRIPNNYAKGCADWYYNKVVPENLHSEFTADGKHDDALFRLYMMENHSGEVSHNMIYNIVDHVDYLIGGSLINKQREGIRKAYRWEEPERVEELKSKLKEREQNARSKTPSKRKHGRNGMRKVR